MLCICISPDALPVNHVEVDLERAGGSKSGRKELPEE